MVRYKSILHCCRAINIDGTYAFLFNCLKKITDGAAARWMSTPRDDEYQEMLSIFPYFITRFKKTSG